ncbi:hypothetical protein Tco_1351262 [Tanacetum coccineum]
MRREMSSQRENTVLYGHLLSLHTCGDKQQQELLCKLLKDVQNVKEELAEDINTPNWDRPAFYYDDDDDDDDEGKCAFSLIILPPLDISKIKLRISESNDDLLRLMTILSLLTTSIMLRHHLPNLSSPTSSLPENESFHFNIPSSPRPPAKPPDDRIYFEPDTGILTVKVVGNISEHHVLTPRLLPTQPTLASNEEKSPHFSSHRGFKASKLFHHKSPMLIHEDNTPTLGVHHPHFYPP